MFLFHTALPLGMLALTAGTALYLWSVRNNGEGVGLAKFIGIFVMIFSIGSIICTIYYGGIYWSKGYFQSPTGINGMMQTQGKSLTTYQP